MVPALGPAASLGYTPFEYWKGPKPVLPGSRRKSQPVAADREPLLPTSTPARKPRAVSTGPGRQLPASAFVAQPGTYTKWSDNGNAPFGEVLVVPPKVLIHPLFRDEIKTPEWPRGVSPYPDSMTDSEHNGTMGRHGFSSETLGRNTAWWNPKGWTKRTWAGVGAGVVLVVIIVAVAVVVTQNNKNRYPDYTKLSYKLSDTYSGEAFFDKFNYFNTYDPTGGMVHYVGAAEAKSRNLTYATPDTAVLRVDDTTGPTSTPDASTGRFSVRVESKTQYDKGLFVFDVKHTPYGCASWPALWFTDPGNWPDAGEIDVMEAVNQGAGGNQVTLHTTPGCAMDVRRKQAGAALRTDCRNSTDGNAGCGVEGPASTYGPGFNDAGGGYVAMEWRDEGIRVWQFPRASAPPDVAAAAAAGEAPDPSGWGEALADFPSTSCDVGSHFRNQSLIVNIDVCGALVEAKYAGSGCGGASCAEFQANNPDAFKTAYWEFGAFHFYTAS